MLNFARENAGILVGLENSHGRGRLCGFLLRCGSQCQWSSLTKLCQSKIYIFNSRTPCIQKKHSFAFKLLLLEDSSKRPISDFTKLEKLKAR